MEVLIRLCSPGGRERIWCKWHLHNSDTQKDCRNLQIHTLKPNILFHNSLPLSSTSCIHLKTVGSYETVCTLNYSAFLSILQSHWFALPEFWYPVSSEGRLWMCSISEYKNFFSLCCGCCVDIRVFVIAGLRKSYVFLAWAYEYFEVLVFKLKHFSLSKLQNPQTKFILY